jgi:hypothetical protein
MAPILDKLFQNNNYTNHYHLIGILSILVGCKYSFKIAPLTCLLTEPPGDERNCQDQNDCQHGTQVEEEIG